MTPALDWHRSEWGQYADSAHEPIRYYVTRVGSRFRLEAFKTVTVAEITTVKPGQNPRLTDWHDSAKLAKATAAAYDDEPDLVPGTPLGGPSRLSRAIDRAYREVYPGA